MQNNIWLFRNIFSMATGFFFWYGFLSENLLTASFRVKYIFEAEAYKSVEYFSS